MNKIIEEEPKHETERDKLWKIFALSVGLDLLTSTGVIATLGLGVVVEELIESAVSQLIAKQGNIELSGLDNTLGLIPLPGVTAVSVHCARKLIKIYFQG